MSDPRLIDWRDKAAICLPLFDVHQSKWSDEEASRLKEVVEAVITDRAITPALRRLIIAARNCAYEDDTTSHIKELREASEAFAAAVPWEDEP